MFQQIQVLEWLLAVDREATLLAYKSLLTAAASCRCIYCRNYTLACHTLPEEMLQILDILGIDAEKPSEVAEVFRNVDGSHFYLGFYHFVGYILQDSNQPLPLGDHLTIVISDQDLSLVPPGFPEPVLQLDFNGDISWLLDEEPEQHGKTDSF